MIPKNRFTCPNIKNHTDSPERYLEWAKWEEEKRKTHEVKSCWGCNMPVVWIPIGSENDELQKIARDLNDSRR